MSTVGRMLLVPLCFMLNVVLGCAAMITPMAPGANDSLRPDEGLVLGRIHITDSTGESFASSRQPFRTSFHMQWRLKDQKLGKEFVIDPLPKDGPFAVKLPTGSYELTAMSFDTALGIWQASLPTTFTVSSQACTYLGTWELRTNAGFFDGSIVRHVIDQHALAENDLQTFVNDRPGCPMVAELRTPMTSPLMLTFRTQGTELTSPP
ncbi:MAG: hypothetical protein U0236_14480 [Nitrospira sp.]